MMATKPPITGTAMSVLGTDPSSPQVFYQTFDRAVNQSVFKDNTWVQEVLPWSPAPLSPLASVTLDGGKEIHVFYVDTDYIVREYILSPGKDWHEGDLAKSKIKATPNSRLDAVSYVDGTNNLIHLFYEDFSSLTLREFVYAGAWKKGALNLANVLAGTAIAAVTRINREKRREITVFYQTKRLDLASQVNDEGWAPGAFNSGVVTGRAPIGAIATGNGEIQAYWRDVIGRIVFSIENPNDEWSAPQVIAGIVPGFELAVVGWDNPKNIRIYVQDATGTVSEWQSANNGSTWSIPTLVVAGSKA